MEQDTDSRPFVLIPTPSGTLRVRVAVVNAQTLLVVTSMAIPEVPVVRFHSSCVFGEAFHAIDCDCGAQLDASLKLIGEDGGILIYAWEEGRGVGIVDKVRAIALQQVRGLSTSEAFSALGHKPDPRTFENHITALRQTFEGSHIKVASRNPQKIDALRNAGYVVDRIKLDVAMTPQREAYLAHKRDHLGHLNDD